jgi:uncharacterized phage protein (predicted DNA packaging)
MEAVNMELEELKLYLRIDSNDEDDVLRLMMGAAENYIVNSVGAFDKEDPQAKILFAAIVQDMYDNRELMQSEQQMKKRMEWLYASSILQLRLKYEIAQEDA